MWKVALRMVTMPMPSQQVITRDNVSIGVAAVAYAPLPELGTHREPAASGSSVKVRAGWDRTGTGLPGPQTRTSGPVVRVHAERLMPSHPGTTHRTRRPLPPRSAAVGPAWSPDNDITAARVRSSAGGVEPSAITGQPYQVSPR
jgi:hypothetical protein